MNEPMVAAQPVTCSHPEHQPVFTQDEADCLTSVFGLDDAAFLLVHRVSGYRGVQPLVQPVRFAEWEH